MRAPFAPADLCDLRDDVCGVTVTSICYAAIHGDGAYAAQELFYTVIPRFNDSGSLGGIRVMARVSA